MSSAARSETIPWEWYVSDYVLRREQELIFRGAWHYAGPLEWVSKPGERFPCVAGEAPVVVVRDRDREGMLRAFLNVCRHRGSVIVDERGRRETLQCPYHAWTYDLDGSLRSVPRPSARRASTPASWGCGLCRSTPGGRSCSSTPISARRRSPARSAGSRS